MRGRIVAVALGFVSLWMGIGALNGQGAAAARKKIGFVDSLSVLYGTEVGRIEIARVQTFLEQKQKEYDSRAMELGRKREQFATQQMTLDPSTRTGMQRQIGEEERALQRFQEDTQVEITRQRDEILEQESGKIQEIINQYAKDRGYGSIFLLDESQVWVDPLLDLTAEIIRLYNERYPPDEPAGAASQP